MKTKEAKKPQRVALFVGVDNYEDSQIPNLNGAVNDATELHDFFLQCRGQFNETEILTNPTSEMVLDAVKRLTASLEEGDFFMFYFAGHGVVSGNTQKLLCSNSKKGRRSVTNAFELDEVAAKEDWHVAILLDACRRSLDADRALGDNKVNIQRDLDFYDALVKSRESGDASLSILFSCDEGMTAGEVEYHGQNHGLFTLALLEILRQADESHRGWCFDQNLGNEIGEAMRRLAHSNYGQRPWIRASGEPPLFFLPGIDVNPLRKLARDLADSQLLSDAEHAKCLQAIGGSSSRACYKGIFKTLEFFANWHVERKKEAKPCELASVLLKAFCSDETNERGNADVVLAECKKIAADNGDGNGASKPLTRDTRNLLRTAAEGVCTDWLNEGSKMIDVCNALIAAKTEEEALDALRAAEDALREAFIRKNLKNSYLNRLDPLFTSKAQLALQRGLPDYFDCGDEVAKALSSLFRFANTCCRTRNY